MHFVLLEREPVHPDRAGLPVQQHVLDQSDTRPGLSQSPRGNAVRGAAGCIYCERTVCCLGRLRCLLRPGLWPLIHSHRRFVRVDRPDVGVQLVVCGRHPPTDPHLPLRRWGRRADLRGIAAADDHRSVQRRCRLPEGLLVHRMVWMGRVRAFSVRRRDPRPHPYLHRGRRRRPYLRPAGADRRVAAPVMLPASVPDDAAQLQAHVQ